ncbi:MAG: glycosyltransferase [Gammaproteobacteria bacterium]|nr:glycosyltransferase [Gammaproteobacteria bacterium]
MPVVRFLNRHLGQKRSGIENAALLRIRAFETELGIVPQYLTVDYDPGFALTRAELIAAGHVSRQVVFQNLYDHFQEIDTHGNDDVRVEFPRNDDWTYVPVPDTHDLKVYGRNQRLLMYVKCSSRNGSVDYINHFHDGRKWRRDTYTPQGLLSRIQYRDIETGEFVNEHYLRPDGSVALIQLFTNQDGRRTLSRVSLMNRDGYCVEDFTSQQDLIAFWLDQLTTDPDTHYVLVSDRNQPYYRPLKNLKMLPGKDNVSVVSIIHSVHVKDALDIHSSRTKFTYAEVLDDIRAPDAVVVGTPSQRRDILRRYGNGNLHVIPHAYSQATAPRNLGFGQRNRKEVVCLGRYQAEKNQQVAIRAFASVVRAVPDATLQLYGAGSQKSALIDLVASLGLQDSVFVNDYASDVTAIYRAAGLSILTSKEEGYPLVLVESLSQGCPVVAFDVNYGPSDLIEHGESGFLVPPGDEQVLAQRICEVLENPGLHERMSANALASSRAFGVDVVADRWKRLIGGLVEGQATRHRGAVDDGAPAEVLHAIRRALVDPAHELTIADDFLPAFDPEISQVYITLFQRGLPPIRWGSRRSDLQKSLARDVAKIRGNKRFKDFNPADPAACRILVEWVTDEYPVAIKDVSTNRFDDHRFEPGITGFRFNVEGQTYHYMPTDAVTKSHMTLKHALNDMSKKCGIAKETDRISKRAKLMKSREICYWMTKSNAIVTDGTDADAPLALYRGYPVPVPEPSDEVLAEAVYAGADWVVDNMAGDGSFLYYYEGIKDTVVDHEHPRMVDPLYYNMLRHGGGTLLLLRAYELGNDPRYLEAARRSLDYLQTTCRTHDVDGEQAVHVICNRKSKLGGTGIALSALMHYVRLSGDSGMRDLIVGMVRHLLSRVDDSGEMIGYYIHPQFCDGKPILAPDAETKRKLFSFYYPGEALLGLALYCRHFPDADEALVTKVKETARRALDFLVHERPKRYPDLFTALPSDGWLMQAIEEWSRFAEFRDDSYKGFVYSDADAMLQHMYTAQNSPYLDYPGGYFYDHGDHVYTDGARSEGLVAAYFLARDLGDEAEMQRFGDGCRLAARNLLFTANTRASLYAHRFPEKSLGSFRFKLTRQWVRIDSAQHVVCFFARLAGAGSSTTTPGRSVSR